MKSKLWIGTLAATLAVAGAAAWWLLRDRDGGVSYRSAKIERGSLQAAVSASGTVTPVTQVQVSAQVSGQIKELFVDFNSLVTAGQLIARLDPETFEYRLRQSNADLEAARASVLTAQANLLQATAQVDKARVDVQEAQRDPERKQDLVARNFISTVETDKAQALVRTLAESLKATEAQVAVASAPAQNAQAIVKQRDAQLAQARVDVERTQIRSPVTGIVIKRSVEVGQTVAASLQAPDLFVIAANVRELLRQSHRLQPAQDDDFGVRNLTEILAAQEESSRGMTLLLAAVAGVSLIVGGIGIMNIMLVGVTERTREIDLRMAVGARGRDILSKVLIEAVTLSLMGDAIGVVLGGLASWGVAEFAGWHVALSAKAVLLAVGFSAAVGVFFGFYPARRAAALLPIEALRYE